MTIRLIFLLIVKLLRFIIFVTFLVFICSRMVIILITMVVYIKGIFNISFIISDIVFYLTKKLSDDKFYYINDRSEISEHLGQFRAVVIAHFKDDKTLKYKFFDDALCDNDDVDVLVGFGDTDMGIKPDSFAIYNAEGRYFVFDSKWETENIKKWVYLHSFPFVINYDSHYNRFIFSKNHDIKSLIVYMSEDNEPLQNHELHDILEELGEQMMGQSFVVDMQADVGGMIDYFGFERETLPLFFYVCFHCLVDV